MRNLLQELLMLIPIIGLSTSSLSEVQSANMTRESCSMGQFEFSLNLTGVGLKNLPDGFVRNEFLTHLILDENQIPMVTSQTFSSLPKLSYLSLANNKLSALELQPFSELRNLETLILRGNCKLRVTAEYNRPQHGYIKTKLYDPNNICSLRFDSNFQNLKYLYLENNSLQKLTFTSGKFPALTHLYLADNQLKIDQETILGLKEFAPALTHLHLNDSGIFEFDLSHLPNITSLHVDKNEIRSICNENCEGSSLKLKGAQRLVILTVSHNQISKIDIDSFNYTTNLTMLDLSHNKIFEIHEGTFDKLHLLRSLSLEFNNLVKLNTVHIFRNLINLENLSLECNNIVNITGRVFENLLKLKKLTLNHNKISNVDTSTFSNLTNLEELSLAGNQLSKIPEGSVPTSGSLISLNLDDNRFTSVEDISIANAPHMLSLSLKDNPLTGMTSRWFSVVPPNLNIILGSSCYGTNQRNVSVP